MALLSRCCLGGLFCVVLTTSALTAGDWTQWGGSDNRNLVSGERNLSGSFTRGQKGSDGNIDPATAENLRWAVRLGSAAYGNPTVADGRVFVGTDDLTVSEDDRFSRTRGGLVKCFDEKTGRLLWQLVVPERQGGLPKNALYGHQHLGVLSSPTVDGDFAYVVTSACEVVCLDVHGQSDGNQGPFLDEGRYMAGRDKPPVALLPRDADIVWCFDMIEELGVVPHDAASCSVLIHGDVLYLSTSNGLDAAHERMLAPEAPAIIALDKRTGRLAAQENDGLSARLFHAQWSSPSLGQVGDRTLVFFGGGDGVCYAFEALEAVPEQPVDLKKVWSYDCNPPEYRFRDGEPIPYYAGDKRKRGSPNKNDGNYLGPSQIIATPVFHNNRVYVPIGQDPAHGRGRGMLHCIDATGTGDITQSGCIWKYDGLDRTIASAAVADGLVYLPDVAGRLHCVDAETGDCCWVYETGAETWGGSLVADGRLYLGTKKNFFVLAAKRQSQVISQVYLGASIYSTPIAANGTLYIASQNYLWAVANSPPRP